MATEAPLVMSQSLHRPNSLLIPPSPAYAVSPRGGILLNARSPHPSSGVSTPRSPSPLASGYSSFGSRKIRFAPLPEPRRDDDEPAPEPPQSPPAVPFDRTDSLITDSGASTNSTDDSQSQTRRKRRSILGLFGMRSSAKRTSTTSLPDAGIPGLGLFRPNSRESWSESGYASDGAAARRMSSPLRPASARSTQPNHGPFAPLVHAQSDSGAQRPQRMLNGRVYGARRARERLQPLPCMEPEFSEWGYGGMGSVGASGEYSKLQSNTSSVGGRDDDDDDDGSGLSWVRKRKEKKEREERERRAAEDAAAEDAKSEDSRQRASTETADSTPTIHAEPAETTPAPLRSNSAISPPRAQPTRSISGPPSRQNSTATVTPDRHHPTVISVPAHRGRQESSAPTSVVTSPESSPERSSGSSRRSSSSDDDEDAEASSSTTGRDEDEEEEEEVSIRPIYPPLSFYVCTSGCPRVPTCLGRAVC
ncbi:hypothetical protein CTheo_1330 [Ceratobasidium theobromae]|uniref:Uncharacterized protein n=1 Tax=Ceratobasidium theobromae TaxID=1582974 RepID=A0A5N5QU17_9AGAM|nr:hypothetical protein CTheo_1330 [Ceratobasidium theobromae]